MILVFTYRFRLPIATDAGDTAAKAIAVAGADSAPTVSTGGQAFGIALALMTACWGGVYILSAKAARSK